MTQPTNYPGFNVMLMGPSGVGKTYAIKTLVDAGLKVRVLFMEPGMETLIGAYSDSGKPLPENLAWHYFQEKQQGFDTLKKTAEGVGKFDQAMLAKQTDMNRGRDNPIIDFYTVLNDFPDQRTGQKLGSVESWGTDCVFVIDSLSALSTAVMRMVIGTKAMKTQAEYGLGQTQLMNALTKLTGGCVCHFVLLAHVDRENDELMGGVKLLPSSIGRALYTQITRPFSDVILSVREGDKFYWDTASSQADVKTRNLPIQAKQPADFAPIVKKWTARMKAATEGQTV